MRISDWSSDVCSSDLIAKRQSLSSGGEIKYTAARDFGASRHFGAKLPQSLLNVQTPTLHSGHAPANRRARHLGRSEEHTSELQSLMRISYAVFCLKKKKNIIR